MVLASLQSRDKHTIPSWSRSVMVGALEAYRGDRYRKTWWLAFFGLWSRGMLFVGPLLILIGIGMVNLSKDQFTDYTRE